MLVMLSLILFSCLHFLCKLNSPEDLLGLRRKRKAPGTKLIGPLWLPISPCTFLTVAKCHGEFWASSWVNYFSSPQPSPSLSLTSSSLLLFLILVALNLNGILCLCSVAKKKNLVTSLFELRPYHLFTESVKNSCRSHRVLLQMAA